MTETKTAETLADVVAPISVETFMAEDYQKKPRLMPGPRERFSGLFNWGDVNDLLKFGALEGNAIRVVKGGKDIAQRTYTGMERRGGTVLRAPAPRIKPGRLQTLLREGATLVLNTVSERSLWLNELCRAMERELHTSVQMNLYAGWKTDNGFAKHWDDHDVFIIQTQGRKRWEVYDDTRPKPLRMDGALQRIPKDPIWKGTLTAGDCLYIPRGFWHVAYPMNEPSMHLTTGTTTIAGDAVMEWLKRRLMEKVAYRADVPVAYGPEAVQAHLARLRRDIEELLGDAAGDQFLADREEGARAAGDTGLPGSAATGEPPAAPAELEMASARPRRIRPAVAGRYVRMHADGRARLYKPAVRPMLEHLAAGGRGTPEALAGRCGAEGAEDAEAAVREMWREGVLRRVPPKPSR